MLGDVAMRRTLGDSGSLGEEGEMLPLSRGTDSTGSLQATFRLGSRIQASEERWESCAVATGAVWIHTERESLHAYANRPSNRAFLCARITEK